MAERTVSRRPRLDVPVDPRRAVRRPHYDPEVFGRFSETIARFIGTARFLVIQTVLIVVWVLWNLVVPRALRFDVYPFQFLTLVLSLQAAYAAPLILLAQNRQADRDRINLEEDRSRAELAQANSEYLAREIASLRASVGEVATREYLRDQLREAVEDVVVRTAVGGEETHERDRREERDERERKAERKKRRQQRRAAEDAVAVPSSLGEPFQGETDTH